MDSLNNDLSWLTPTYDRNETDPLLSTNRPRHNAWLPLDRHIDRIFGLPEIGDILKDDSDDESTVGGPRAPTKEEVDDANKRSEREGLKAAQTLMCEGAQAPSVYSRHHHDLERMPPQMTGFPEAVELWPHQSAAAGRLHRILLVHFCALLAWEMGLGKTYVALAILSSMGLCTSKQLGPVLIVLPRSLLLQWKNDIETKIVPRPRVCVYHDGRLDGHSTSTSYTVEELESYDIILTTYSIVRLQHDRMRATETLYTKWLPKKFPLRTPQHGHYPLFAIAWWFVILDEAHRIANPVTSLSFAARSLPGKYRLAMTGTPLHNEYTDVQGILAFLRIHPWSDLEFFKKYFIQKRTKKTHGDILNNQLTAILAATLQAISLRLTVEDTFDDEPVAKFIPASENVISQHLLSPQQRAAQNLVKHIWDVETRRDVEERRKKWGYQGPLSPEETFPAIVAARLSLVHDACPTAGYGDSGEKDPVVGLNGRAESGLEDHLLRVAERTHCDRQPKRKKQSKERREAFRLRMKTDWHSARIQKILDIVAAQKKKGKEGKFLVFSEFLCVLDVIQAALESCGYRVLRYDGWMNTTDKEYAIERFQDLNDAHEFLLITNRSGGEGINLQVATTVIQPTPCWSPAMTQQCNSRAVRNGQTDEVDVFYFCLNDSIEQYMYRLSRTKAKKASTLLDPPETIRETMEEIPSWTLGEFVELMQTAQLNSKAYRDEMRARRSKDKEAKKAKELAEAEEAAAEASLGPSTFVHDPSWQYADRAGTSMREYGRTNEHLPPGSRIHSEGGVNSFDRRHGPYTRKQHGVNAEDDILGEDEGLQATEEDGYENEDDSVDNSHDEADEEEDDEEEEDEEYDAGWDDSGDYTLDYDEDEEIVHHAHEWTGAEGDDDMLDLG